MKSENNSISLPKRKKKTLVVIPPRLFAALLITVVMLGAVVQPGLSQPQAPTPPPPMPTWTLETVDGPRYFTNMTDRSVAYKDLDTPCAAYGGDGLYYACYDSEEKVWNVQVIDSSPDVGQYASLTFYTRIPSGIVDAYISYYDNANGKLKLAYSKLGEWKPIVTVPDPGWTDVNGPQYLSEDSYESDLTPMLDDKSIRPDYGLRQFMAPEVSILAESEPAYPVKTNKGYGKYTSIAANYDGVYISFYDDRDEFTYLEDPRCIKANFPLNKCEYNLKVAFWNGTDDIDPPGLEDDWEFDLVDDYADQGRVGLWSSIKVDKFSNLHLAYMSEKYDTLKYAFWNHNKGVWDERKTVDGGYPSQVGPMCSIDVGKPDTASPDRETPYISYLDDDGRNLRVAKLISMANNDWTKETVDSGDNVGWYTSIALDPDNVIHISYYLADTGDLKYAKGKIGQDWDKKIVYKGGGLVGLFTSIALGKDSNPGILHLNISKAELLFTRYKDSKTFTTSVVDSGGDVGYASSVKVSPLGFPYISYLDATMGNLKLATIIDTPTWLTYYPAFGPHMGIYNDLELFEEKLRLAAYDSDKGNLVYSENHLGHIWDFEYIQKGNDAGQYVSLAVDSIDIPHFSFYDATNQNLVYGTWQVIASDWVTTVLDIPGDVGKYTSIALSSDDRPYISYYDASNHNLKVAYLTPGLFWKIETVDGGPDWVGMYSSIALDTSNRPHIAYYAEQSDSEEKFRKPRYIYWNGSAWKIDDTFNSTDPNNDDEQGTYTSLVINPADDTRHVCYYNKTKGALIYARYTGIWEFATVDTLGDTGYACSITLTSAGEPVITYYDNTGSDLEIAYSDIITWPALSIQTFLPLIK